jgi:PIN domain nuclease of toxin-antitoxin system
MRLLLDTHALLWWLEGSRRLSKRAREAIANEASEIFVSAATAWEIATKVRIGKLPSATSLPPILVRVLREQRFASLAISVDHGTRAGSLPGTHRDPFDRMLIAQAQAEDLDLVTNERDIFGAYGIRTFW